MRRLIHFRFLPLAFLSLILLFSFPQAAGANPVQNALSGACTTIFTQNQTANPPGVTAPVVACMTAIVNSLAGTMVNDVVNAIRNTVLALMTMAVIVIGFRIMFGSLQRGIGKELTILLLKMAAVSAFVLSPTFTSYINDITAATGSISSAAIGVISMNASVPRSFSYISPNGYLSELVIPPTTSTYQVAVPGGQIWFFVDEIIRTILGTNLPGAIAGVAVVLALCLLMMAMGPIGFWVILTVMAVVTMMFISLAMAVYLYIVSMLAILFLTAIGPICIPMILFRSWGMPMFDAWLRQVISYSMQPLILTVFFVFMIVVLFSITTDLGLLYREAFANPPRTVSIAELSQQRDVNQTDPTLGLGRENITFEGGRNVQRESPGTVAGWIQGYITFPVLDWPLDRVKDLIITLMLAFICMLVMFQFQRDLPDMVTELVGQGDRTIQNLAAGNFGDQVKKMGNMATDMVAGMGKGAQDGLGTIRGLTGK